MNMKKLIIAATLGLAVLSNSGLTFAMGQDDSSGTKPKPVACKQGYIYSEKKKRCVRQTSGDLERSDYLRHAWAKAYTGDYKQARGYFAAYLDRPTAEVFNGLGYTNRKLGNLDTGISYYLKALELDPGYVLARSYLGEGYVQAGKIDLARKELSEIGRRCGKGCKEYIYLMRVVETGSPNDW